MFPPPQRNAFEKARQQSVDLQRTIDRQTGYIWLIGTLEDPRDVAKLLQVMRTESAEIAQLSLDLHVSLEQIRQQRKERMKNITVMILLALVTLLLVVHMPTRAQDATAEAAVESTATPAPAATEQPPVVVVPSEPGDTQLIDLVKQALPWAGAVAIVAIIAASVVFHQAIVNLGRSAPVPVREVAITSGDSVLKQVEDYVKTTPTQIDDVAAAELRKLFDQWVAEIRETPPTAGTVTATFSRNVPVPEPPQQPGVVG